MDAKKLLDAGNELLSDRVRLAIMATLAAADEPVEFKVLLETLGLTKGNLSSHVSRLEEAALVEVKKEFVGKRPRTSYACTPAGREAIIGYLKQVEEMLKGAVKS